jgi:hypothetical protein
MATMLSRTTTRAVCTTALPRLVSSQARPACAVLLRHAQAHNKSRTFASTALVQMPQKQIPELKLKLESEYTHAEPAWPHPVYNAEQMEQIVCIPLHSPYP